MAGFSSVTSSQSIMFADNVSFDGTERGGAVTTDGQLLIGATAAPHLRPGLITSTGGTVDLTFGAGTINLESGSSVPTSFVTDSGTATPSSGVLNDVGSGSIQTSGIGNTKTTFLTGLTNHAVLVGAGTSTITKVGPTATAGQVFQSAGASADPTFSTATYPSTATGTGKILRADGTNWVATTATYPDTAGTSGNVLTSDGTNFVSSALPLSQYTDTSGTQTLTANTSYFATAASTFTLPASPSHGNKIRVVCDTTSSVVLTANTGQTIRIGVNISSTGGTQTNASRGDSVTLVYRSTGSVWVAEDFIGNWTNA